MYRVEYAASIAKDLRELRAYERTRILNAVEAQLRFEPTVPSQRRKLLVGLIPPWEHVEPIWQLRVGDYRVFYDVMEEDSTVIIRAIRRKPPHRRTEEIL